MAVVIPVAVTAAVAVVVVVVLSKVESRFQDLPSGPNRPDPETPEPFHSGVDILSIALRSTCSRSLGNRTMRFDGLPSMRRGGPLFESRSSIFSPRNFDLVCT